VPTVVIMPALGMAQDTGKVVRWLRAEGDAVERGEPLLEIETDKVTVEIEAPATGALAGICASEGDDVPVGEAIAWVLAAGESLDAVPVAAPAAVAEAQTVAPERRTLASPKARRLAANRGVDLAAVRGSGPGGAIIAADIAADIASEDPAAISPEPVGSVWRVMAERTTASWQSVPQFHLRRDVDATRFQSWRDVARSKPGGEAVNITDLLVKVVAESLRRHPRVNSSWRDGELVPAPSVNVALAVATDEALVVPVIHGADRLALPELAARRKALVAAARAGELRPADVSDGTFTISNLGMFGVDSFDAIVNAPQAGILAVGRIADRIVAVAGTAAVRPMLQLTLTFDHRVVDGARGAAFLDTLATLLEEPAGLVA
jgi:pyruvate dehydrogenase E2 component (dihydrolipoamide acetyltransferase)